MPSSTSWASARRVLAVRLDTIGDVVMTGPALRALKESGPPGRSLTLLTSPPGAAVADLMPEADEAIVYEAPWMKASGERPDPAPDHQMIDRLRGGGFDAAVIFTVYSQSPLPAALLCHLAGIPLRLAHCRERAYALLSDAVPDPEPAEGVRHEVRRQLDLVATVGASARDERLRLEPPAAARRRAGKLAPGGSWAVLHPGGSAPSRRWPAERWGEVCRALTREHGVSVVVTGDADERGLAERVADGAGAVVAGELGLADLAALIEAAPLLLSGNTGPVHLAAATGTPVVDLYALTNPQHTPWAVPARVLFEDVPCRWCYGSVCREGHHRCLRGVEVRQVVEAALQLLRDPVDAEARLPPVQGRSIRSRPPDAC